MPKFSWTRSARRPASAKNSRACRPAIGRSNSGTAELSHYFLKLFGRPTRQSACECERNGEPSVGQVLHLLNAPEITKSYANPRGAIARLVTANQRRRPIGR